jgi:hypothetical protein
LFSKNIGLNAIFEITGSDVTILCNAQKNIDEDAYERYIDLAALR